MAIVKVGVMTDPPVEADYTNLIGHLQASTNQMNGLKNILKQVDTSHIPTLSQGSYISIGGVLYIVGVEDYVISGSVVTGYNYVKIAISGELLIASWVRDVSSYVWNSVYGYYSDGTNMILPYRVSYITGYVVSFYNPLLPGLTKNDSPTFAGLSIQGFKSVIVIGGSILSSFNLPVVSFGGVTADTTTGNLITSNDLVFSIHDKITSAILSSFNMPKVYNAIAFDPITSNLVVSRYSKTIDVYNGASSSRVSSFVLPYNYSTSFGIVIDPNTGNLIASSPDDNRIHVYNKLSNSELSSFVSPSGSVRNGLAINTNNGNLIVCNGSDYYIQDGISATNVSSFSNVGISDVNDIAYSGTNLISSDETNDKIYIHANTLIFEEE